MQALLAHQLWHTGCLAGVPPESAEKMSATAQAYIIFHCSSRELQQRAGFDGWVMLLRDEFDTEDQAWPQEKLRLSGIAKRKMRRLEAGGVELDMLQLSTSSHLLLEPPRGGRDRPRKQAGAWGGVQQQSHRICIAGISWWGCASWWEVT